MDRCSASGSRHSSRKPRKRAFDGNGVIELEYTSEESDTEEKMSTLTRKGKEIMVQEGIAIDDDGCLHEVKLHGNYKGKDLLYVSEGSDYDDKKATFFKEQSSSSTSAATDEKVNGDCPINFIELTSDSDQDDYNYLNDADDDLGYVPQNQWYGMDEISYLQAQFENTDIPTDIEAVIPWWSEPDQSNAKAFNLMGPSNSSSTQLMLGSGLDQTPHSHDTKSMVGSISSAGSSCLNGSTSVPSKHESLPNNHAGDVFDPTPTEFPSEISGTSSATNLKEAAMMRLRQFEKFAVVDDYADHHYVNVSLGLQLEKASAKKIQDEWRILQSSLPDTIFVRTYESQMALLRAVIIGPQGTPYHDGLFFFDVMFPPNYPSQPPKVYYHSGGLRINPNLYENGKVCLSLLGTWPGRNATENWIPGKSTLLQILVSIQALILNANPYFNEPGHSSSNDIYAPNASELYNEETLIKSLKTMIYSMKKPPKHFEEFVADHFITRSRDILLACEAYMNGAQVGSISIMGSKAVRDNDKRCSPYLKDNVGNSMNSLIDEFAKLGVNDCGEFRVPVVSKIKEPLDDCMGSTWLNLSQSHVSAHFGSAEFSKAKLKPSSSHYMSAPFPPAPGVAYPFLLPPTDMHAAPFLPAPGNAHPIRPFPMMISPFMSHPGVAYPSPPTHIAMSSSRRPRKSSLPVPASNPPVRLGSPRPPTLNAHPIRRSVHRPSNYSWQKPSKPDDLKGNVHKWSDG